MRRILLVLAILIAAVGFAGLRLTPIFLEHMKITRVLEDVKINLDGQSATVAEIRSSIGKRLNIEMVRSIKPQDFKIKKSEEGYSVRLQYDSEAPYIANVYLLVRYNKAVEIRR